MYGAYRATITATDDVFCDAEYGCYYADITSGSYVYLDASRAAYYADITAEGVYVYSRYGIYGADITSVSGSSLRVYLYALYSGLYGNIYALETSNTYDAYIYCYCDTACYGLDVYYYGELDDIYVYPTDCKDNQGTTNDDGVYCPTFTSSSSMSEEEYKSMRKTQIEASKDYEEFKKLAEEPVAKAEKERIAAEKEAKEKAKATEMGDENKIFANVGLLMNTRLGLNMAAIYGMICTALLTFMVTACYYSRFKDQDIKYQPLL